MNKQNHLMDDKKKWKGCELNMSVTAKGLTTYGNVVFFYFFLFANISTLLFFGVVIGCWVYIYERQNYLFFDFRKMVAMKERLKHLKGSAYFTNPLYRYTKTQCIKPPFYSFFTPLGDKESWFQNMVLSLLRQYNMSKVV